MTSQERSLPVRDYGVVIPDEVDPKYQHTRLTVQQMGVDMNTEKPWVWIAVTRERPGQHPAECLSVGITDPETMQTLRDVLNNITVEPQND